PAARRRVAKNQEPPPADACHQDGIHAAADGQSGISVRGAGRPPRSERRVDLPDSVGWHGAVRASAVFMTRPRRVLLAILVVAAIVRIWGAGFGMPFVNARPDETQIAGPAVGFLSGNLRPPLLEWPTLMPYATALCYLLYFALTRPFGSYHT